MKKLQLFAVLFTISALKPCIASIEADSLDRAFVSPTKPIFPIPSSLTKEVLQMEPFHVVEKRETKAAASSRERLLRNVDKSIADLTRRQSSSENNYFDEHFPSISSLLEGFVNLSHDLAKYRYGQPVSFAGKYRGRLEVHRNFLITPPGQRYAELMFQYGGISMQSRFLPSKFGPGINWKY